MVDPALVYARKHVGHRRGEIMSQERRNRAWYGMVDKDGFIRRSG